MKRYANKKPTRKPKASYTIQIYMKIKASPETFNPKKRKHTSHTSLTFPAHFHSDAVVQFGLYTAFANSSGSPL